MLLALLLLPLLITPISSKDLQNFISNAIDQFTGYTLIFHIDNSTLAELDLPKFHNNSSLFLANCDAHLRSKIYRRNGLRHLHVILFKDPLNFQKPLAKTNLELRDVVLITSRIYLTRSMRRNICGLNELSRSGGVFIIESDSETRDRLSHCCYYCGKRKVSVKEIEVEGEDVPNLKKFLNNHTNFGGYTFKIGFTQYIPFFYHSYDNATNAVTYHGAEWHIMKSSSKLLNFRFKLIEYFQVGNDTAWELMIKDILSGKIDWAISGITQTPGRTKAVDYSRHNRIQTYMAIYRSYEDRWKNTKHLLYSMYISFRYAFMALGVSVAAIAVITKISLKISNGVNVSLVECAVMTVIYVIEQQSPKLQRRLKSWKTYVKIIFLLWWISCWTLTSFYKSQMAALLIPRPADPQDVEDIADKGFEFEVNIFEWNFLRLSCLNSMTAVCTEMLKATIVTDICPAVIKTLSRKTAYVSNELPLQYMALRNCHLTLNQKYSLRLITVKILGNELHAWPMKKHTPFMGSLSRIIARLAANGLISYWDNRHLGNFRRLSLKNQEYLHGTAQRALDLYHFVFPFTILAVGYLLSIVAYLIEIYPKLKMARKHAI